MLKKIIVHLPKFALSTSSFSSFSGMLSVRMLGKRIIAKDKAHAILHAFKQLFDVWIGPTTIGTLKIAIFNEGNLALYRSSPMIPFTHGRR
jgi:hypothetical protein